MPSAYSAPAKTDRRVVERSLAGARPRSFWLDGGAPIPESPLIGSREADLVVVGGGYAGLWTALLAKESDPSLSVYLLEGQTCGWAASGRNGGFCESSLTHGFENGERHFADELHRLDELGMQNLAAIGDTLIRYSVDAEWELNGVLSVATEDHQIEWVKEAADREPDGAFLNAQQTQALVASPLYKAGARFTESTALVHPAKLAWALREICLRLGVVIAEHTPVKKIRNDGDRVDVLTASGSIRARKVALATNAFPSLLKRTALLTIPVYDYVLMTEPLTDAQLASIGWEGRFGISDMSRQFHYYRLSADNRILWGGYDAVYHRGGRVERAHDQRPETFEKLADHFFRTFPQLEDVNFSHTWGGAIDMSTRFVAHTGKAMDGKVAYSAGYTGLGVGATRFGAQIMLDHLSGEQTELTQLKMARTKPVPIPPEPLAYPAIQLTRRAVAKSDENGGRDGLLIKTMGLFGVGFDS
jgi:glycine/D-amino acid oxidase-like deaminating enzyme